MKLKVREYLVIAFIIVGILCLVFERKFDPTYYTVTGIGDGYVEDIELDVKAYKKKNGDIRVVSIDIRHHDTNFIADPAFSHLTEQIFSQQKHSLDVVAGATSSSLGFIEAYDDALEQIIYLSKEQK